MKNKAEELLQIKKRIDTKQRRVSEAKGAIKSLKEDLQKQYKIHNTESIETLLQQLEDKIERKEQEMTERIEALLVKFPSIFED